MNTDQIKHLAHLSQLALTDREVDTYAQQFKEIVSYVDKIKEVTSNNEASNQVEDNTSVFRDDVSINVLRSDEVSSYIDPQIIINEAPDTQDNFVKVKKILQQ
jgi:aspartyl-tRNA(Asn)/glutamyl-tRNA(Gln) amidotransferase subunit C